MIRRMRQEEGSALVTAIVLIVVMLGLGMAVHAVADTQQQQSGQERVRESALTLTEALLNEQVFQISRRFPFLAADALPSVCDPTSSAASPCPDPATMSASFSGPDYAAQCNGAPAAAWQTRVRDNGGGSERYYTRAVVDAQPSWDANADGTLWIRAEGQAGCRRRTLVTQVKAVDVTLPFPRNVVTANWVRSTNNGNKVIIDTQGTAAQPVDISVRCQAPAPTNCLAYDRAKGQAAPDTGVIGYSPDPLLSDAQMESVKIRARRNGTYYAAGQCPTSLAGEVVYLEDTSGCGYYPGESGPFTHNSLASPGFLVVERGTLHWDGNREFYGLVYMRNKQASSDIVLSIDGTALITGGVAIDGAGGLSVGSSALNLRYDPRAASLAKGLASAVAVPNTWRELRSGA